MNATNDSLLLELKELRKAVKDIAPWLAASLGDNLITGKHNNCCKEYIEACNLIFKADSRYN